MAENWGDVGDDEWLRLMDLREPMKDTLLVLLNALHFWRFRVGKHNIKHYIGWTDDGQMVDLTQ